MWQTRQGQIFPMQQGSIPRGMSKVGGTKTPFNGQINSQKLSALRKQVGGVPVWTGNSAAFSVATQPSMPAQLPVVDPNGPFNRTLNFPYPRPAVPFNRNPDDRPASFDYDSGGNFEPDSYGVILDDKDSYNNFSHDWKNWVAPYRGVIGGGDAPGDTSFGEMSQGYVAENPYYNTSGTVVFAGGVSLPRNRLANPAGTLVFPGAGTPRRPAIMYDLAGWDPEFGYVGGFRQGAILPGPIRTDLTL